MLRRVLSKLPRDNRDHWRLVRSELQYTRHGPETSMRHCSSIGARAVLAAHGSLSFKNDSRTGAYLSLGQCCARSRLLNFLWSFFFCLDSIILLYSGDLKVLSIVKRQKIKKHSRIELKDGAMLFFWSKHGSFWLPFPQLVVQQSINAILCLEPLELVLSCSPQSKFSLDYIGATSSSFRISKCLRTTIKIGRKNTDCYGTAGQLLRSRQGCSRLEQFGSPGSDIGQR